MQTIAYYLWEVKSFICHCPAGEGGFMETDWEIRVIDEVFWFLGFERGEGEDGGEDEEEQGEGDDELFIGTHIRSIINVGSVRPAPMAGLFLKIHRIYFNTSKRPHI